MPLSDRTPGSRRPEPALWQEGDDDHAETIMTHAARAEAEFHALVAAIVREAMAQNEPPDRIRKRVVTFFLQEPTFRASDLYEQERVVAGIQRTIEAALDLGPDGCSFTIDREPLSPTRDIQVGFDF